MRYDDDRIHFTLWLISRPILAIIATIHKARKAQRTVHRPSKPSNAGPDANRITPSYVPWATTSRKQHVLYQDDTKNDNCPGNIRNRYPIRSRATLASSLGARPLAAFLIFTSIIWIPGCTPKTPSLSHPGQKDTLVELEIEEGDIAASLSARKAALESDIKAFNDKDAEARADLNDQAATNNKIIDALEGFAQVASNTPLSTTGIIGMAVNALGVAAIALHAKNALTKATASASAPGTPPTQPPATG
jgi:hypothetical protein